MNFDDVLAKLYQATDLLQALDDELSLTLDHVGTKSLTTEEARAIDSTKQLSAYDEMKGGGDNA